MKFDLCFCNVPFMIKFVLLFLRCPIYDRVCAVTFEMSCLWLSLCFTFEVCHTCAVVLQDLFDYEVDSDDEWEEEEPGESLSASEVQID